MRKESLLAFKWNVADLIITQAITFVFNILLIRLLSPTEFGYFAIPFLLFSLIRLIQDLDFSILIVQDQEINERDISAIFWVLVCIGLLGSILCGCASIILSRVYIDSPWPMLIGFMACTVFAASFYYVPEARLRKALDFKKLFFINLAATSLSGIVGLIAAKFYPNLALAIKYVVYIICLSVAVWIACAWKPMKIWNPGVIKKYQSFTIPLIKNQLADFASRNLDTLLVGKFMGTLSLGIYDRAYKILLFPITQVAMAFTKVSLPTLSKIQHEPQRIVDSYLLISRLIALLVFPMMLGLLAISDIFVPTIFGQQWMSMVPLLNVFCVISILFAINAISPGIFISKGKTSELYHMNLITNGILICSMIGAIFYSTDIVKFTYVYGCAAIICFAINLWFTSRILEISVLRVGINFLPMLLIACIMMIAILALKPMLLANFSPIVALCLCFLTGGLLYFLLLKISGNKSLNEAITLYHEALNQ